ncbi:MAG: MFS transporter [Rhabdochlamydiaceae bacterium]|nr:MFS transporter [Rhabdochlamydiaceae bacterium]
MFKTRLSALIGNVFNHYETSLFGWLTPFLAPILFPDKSGTDALLLTFAFLPLSYLMKPLGALFWGWLGDRSGRKPVLISCMLGMALSTFMIGCLPLNAGAWKFLAVCRLAQGFFAAGEEKGAALFLLENTPENKRNWMSAFYDASGIIGIFLASLLASLFGESSWRFLFWAAALGGVLAAILRKHTHESPEFKSSKGSWKVLWQERALITKIAIVSGFSYANYFIVTVFLNGFLPQISNLTKKDMMAFNTHLLWIDFLLLLGFGYLCRWIEKERLMRAASLTAAICIMPLFCLIEGATWWQVAGVRLVLVTLGVALAAPYHAWKIELLPKNHRFLVGSFASMLGSKVLGAPVPFLAAWLVAETGAVWMAALPVVITGLASAIVITQRKAVGEERIGSSVINADTGTG